MRKTITCLLVLCIPVMVAAEEPAAPADDLALQRGDQSVITLGLKGGVGLPQLGSALETTFCIHLEAAYQLPFWGSRLGLITSLGYTQPTASGSGSDPRLPGGEYTWETTQRQTTWDIGVLIKVMERTSPWNLGVAVGARIVFLSTLTSGEAGDETFGEHDERATIPGVFTGAQGEYRLGPGAVFLELSLGMSFQDLRTTGDLTVMELGILAGYRFSFAL
ncbi:MAG TPA: hypothetical protein VM425_03260 [Myxococcota bacterium]|nr:hypothetical protein [Myxococcota bacterium]